MPRKWLILALVACSVVLLDQITKIYIDQTFALYESVIVIPHLFSLTYIRNPGAAFGLFADQSSLFRTIFFSVVSLVALSFLLTMVYQTEAADRWQIIALSLLLGGAIGNLIDRVRLGEVIDFLDFHIRASHWPAFNVADSAITIGVSMLMLAMLRDMKGRKVTE
ncbi:MAG: signal peptidase II [Nitrospirota bacterium]